MDEELKEKTEINDDKADAEAAPAFSDLIAELRETYENKLAAQELKFSNMIRERDDVIKQILTAPAKEEKTAQISEILNAATAAKNNKNW